MGAGNSAAYLARPGAPGRIAPRLATTALIAACAVVVVLGLLELRVGWRLSYDNPDVPTEMMVYTQTSVEVKRAVLESNQLSRELAGQADGEILFDTGADGLSWPLYWYFRSNPDARAFAGTLSPDTDAAVIFMLTTRSSTPQNSQVLANYTGVDYAFRWHFPGESLSQLRDRAGTRTVSFGMGRRGESARSFRRHRIDYRELGNCLRRAWSTGIIPDGHVSRYRRCPWLLPVPGLRPHGSLAGVQSDPVLAGHEGVRSHQWQSYRQSSGPT